MKQYKSLSYTRWDCKYHVVFIPKYRRKKIYGAIRTHLGKILHELAKQKEARILEGHLMSDHVHMCISIPPKFAVSNVVGFIKRQECDLGGTELPRTQTQLHRRKLLGTRLLRVDRRLGRRDGPQVNS